MSQRHGQLRYYLKDGAKLPSEPELRAMVSPELAAAYESLRAGLVRMEVRFVAVCNVCDGNFGSFLSCDVG